MKREKQRDRETLAKTVLGLLMFAAACLIMRGGRRLMEAVSSDDVKMSGERPCVGQTAVWRRTLTCRSP